MKTERAVHKPRTGISAGEALTLLSSGFWSPELRKVMMLSRLLVLKVELKGLGTQGKINKRA